MGDAVEWLNADEILHTATSGMPGSPAGVFDGVMPGKDRTFRFTFNRPGTYPYFCSRHTHMRGTIVVAE